MGLVFRFMAWPVSCRIAALSRARLAGVPLALHIGDDLSGDGPIDANRVDRMPTVPAYRMSRDGDGSGFHFRPFNNMVRTVHFSTDAPSSLLADIA